MRYHDSTIDLHTHTTASDGAFTPEALVERARSKGITHLAITDHDTTLGIARAMARAKQDDLLGQIQIIPGVEISTSFKTVQIHIAGLFIDPDCEVMKRFVERQLSLRKWRAEEMGRKLEGAGFPHIYEEITEGLDPDKPLIVLDHEPSQLSELAAAGVDVDLGGHTHDGQVFPVDIVMEFLWENPCGYLKKGQMHSIVTSGAGLFGPNMRVGTKAEICVVDVQFAP